MSYIGNSPGVASQRVTTTLTATAAQTQFTTQSGYVLGYVDVYLNGAKLVNGADFEAITGTYITLFTGAAAGDVVELISYVPRGLTDGYTKAEADAKFLDVGGDTASGTLALAAASLSGNLTLSGGTANGVGFLNASKVLASGSALTFDGSILAAPTLNLTNALGIAYGGTGQTTANAGLNALLPTQTGNATKYLQTNGTNTSWDAISISTSDITGTLPVANGGTGLTAFTSGGLVFASSTSALATGSAVQFDGSQFSVLTAGNSPVQFSSSSASNTLIQLTNANASKDLISRFRQNGGSGNWWDLTMEGSTNAFTFEYNDGELLRITSAGNVGIGTSSPLGKLHLSKTGDLAAYKTYSGLGNTGAGDGIFEAYRLDGPSNYLRVLDIVALGDSTNNRGSETRFFTTNTSGSTAERVKINSDGNVLINTQTNTNSSKLVVNGTISQTVGGTQYLVVDQSDIGTGANEIPLNQYLGNMAYADSANYYNTGMTTGFRNRIINGDMRINQRGATAQTFNDSVNVRPVDNFTGAALSDGGITGEQSTDAPTGFSNSIKCIVTSADASLSSTQYARIYLQNEGLNVSDFAWGTTNASPVTLSFWTKSSVVGIYGGTFQNSARDRSFAFNYTINTANTWEYKTIIIAGDTTGTWLKDNTTGIRIAWGLAAGSTYQQSNVGVWESTGVKFAPSNALNLLATNGATWYITGIQLERGNVATPFDMRPYGTELALCQRYCVVWGGSSYTHLGTGTAYNTTSMNITVPVPVPMRATPTPSKTTTGGNWLNVYVGSSGQDSNSTPEIGEAGVSAYRIYTPASGTGWTTGQSSSWCQVLAGATFTLSAEL